MGACAYCKAMADEGICSWCRQWATIKTVGCAFVAGVVGFVLTAEEYPKPSSRAAIPDQRESLDEHRIPPHTERNIPERNPPRNLELALTTSSGFISQTSPEEKNLWTVTLRSPISSLASSESEYISSRIASNLQKLPPDYRPR